MVLRMGRGAAYLTHNEDEYMFVDMVLKVAVQFDFLDEADCTNGLPVR